MNSMGIEHLDVYLDFRKSTRSPYGRVSRSKNDARASRYLPSRHFSGMSQERMLEDACEQVATALVALEAKLGVNGELISSVLGCVQSLPMQTSQETRGAGR